jgi:hypothetical protein
MIELAPRIDPDPENLTKESSKNTGQEHCSHDERSTLLDSVKMSMTQKIMLKIVISSIF